jgi:hypothetical protein
MGEEADKMNADEARVLHLRQQIASKRQELSGELEELRRRREAAIDNGRRLLKLAGAGAVGMVVLGSLTNAVIDLFAADDSFDRYRGHESEANAGTGLGILGLAAFAAKWAAQEYVRYKLTEHKERLRSDRNWESKYGKSSSGRSNLGGNGDYRAPAPG